MSLAATATSSHPADLRVAFAALQNRIEALSLPAVPPHRATEADLTAFADHLAEAGDAFRAYAGAVHATLAAVTPARLDDHTGTLEDVIGDVVGALRSAARRCEAAAASRQNTVRAGYRHALPTPNKGEAA